MNKLSVMKANNKAQTNRETLVAELRNRGVTYLAPGDAVAESNFSSDLSFLSALLEQSDSRLRLALIPLFIRHPDLAAVASALVNQSDAALALELQTLYMAAVYLQRRWWTRLSFYLDTREPLPDLYSQTMNLPLAEEQFGKVGLYELADLWQARSRFPFDWLASMNQTMDLFFAQLKLEDMQRHTNS